MKKFRFYKEENIWYIDLPEYIAEGGSKSALAMVSGADTFLDKISYKEVQYLNSVIEASGSWGESVPYRELVKEDEVLLDISLCPFQDATVLMQVEEDEDELGVWYISLTDGHLLWLCPVTKYIFGSYPRFIYIKKC